MAGSVNRAIIIGNLGKDPELRHTSNGKAVADFSVATSESWGKGNDREEKTEWHRVVVWDKLAELCGEYLAKGRKVYVEGRIQTRKWEDRDGNERWTTEIVAREVVFLSGREDSSAGGRHLKAVKPGGRNPGFTDGGQPVGPDFEDEDIPF